MSRLLDGVAQLGHQPQLVARLGTGRLVQDGDPPLAAGLRLVHGDVAVADQVLGRGVLGGLDGDADAGVGPDVEPAQAHRLGQRDRDPLGQRDGVGLADLLAHDDELVAAEPGDQVAGADGGAQPLGDLDEQLVTGGVAERVVDDLEVVQVEEQAGEVSAAGHEPAGDVLRQQRAVGQLGQRVVVGLVGERRLEGQPVGDVLDRADEAGADTRGEEVGEPDDRGALGAVVAHEPGLDLDLAALEGVGDALDDGVEVVGVHGVDPAGAEQLLGAQPDQRAERVVDVRQPHALLREQRRDRRALGQRGEPALVGVGGGAQRAVLLARGRHDADGPHPAAGRRRRGDGDVQRGTARGADRQRHARGPLATQQQLELTALEGREEVRERQRPEVVQAVAEQVEGAGVAPGEALARARRSPRRGWPWRR